MVTGRRLLKTSLGLLFCLMLVGAVMMMRLEGWDATTAVYFGCVTSLVIGYGDLPITSDTSRSGDESSIAYYLLL